MPTHSQVATPCTIRQRADRNEESYECRASTFGTRRREISIPSTSFALRQLIFARVERERLHSHVATS